MTDLEIAIDKLYQTAIDKLSYLEHTLKIQRRYIAELEKQLEPEVIAEIKEELEHEISDL